MPVAAPERLAEQLDRARVRVEQPGEEPHRRRLAGAVGTQEAVDDPGRHGQVEAVEREARAIALPEPARGEGETGICHVAIVGAEPMAMCAPADRG